MAYNQNSYSYCIIYLFLLLFSQNKAQVPLKIEDCWTRLVKVEPRSEEIEIGVIEEVSSREFASQSRGTWKEAVFFSFFKSIHDQQACH